MESSQAVVDTAVQEAVKQASPHGWEAVILVLVMAMLIGLTGVIVRWLIKSMDARMVEATAREERMATRLGTLETFVQESLVQIINETSGMTAKVLDAVTALTHALDRRPCLLPAVKQKELLDAMVAEHYPDSVQKPRA